MCQYWMECAERQNFFPWFFHIDILKFHPILALFPNSMHDFPRSGKCYFHFPGFPWFSRPLGTLKMLFNRYSLLGTTLWLSLKLPSLLFQKITWKIRKAGLWNKFWLVLLLVWQNRTLFMSQRWISIYLPFWFCIVVQWICFFLLFRVKHFIDFCWQLNHFLINSPGKEYNSPISR